MKRRTHHISVAKDDDFRHLNHSLQRSEIKLKIGEKAGIYKDWVWCREKETREQSTYSKLKVERLVQKQLFAALQEDITALTELSCKVELEKRKEARKSKGETFTDPTHSRRPASARCCQ